MEKHVADEGNPEDDAATEQLGTGSPEERTDDITTEEDGRDQVADFGARVELRSDVQAGGGGCGGSERAKNPSISISRVR